LEFLIGARKGRIHSVKKHSYLNQHPVENFVDYFREFRSTISISPLVNSGQFLVSGASLYLSIAKHLEIISRESLPIKLPLTRLPALSHNCGLTFVNKIAD